MPQQGRVRKPLKRRQLRRPRRKLPADRIRALHRAQKRGVDFQIVHAWPVHLFLPQTHGQWHGIVRRAGHISPIPRAGRTPLHDDFDRAANADKQHRQAGEPASAIGQNVKWFRVGIVMTDIRDDIQPQSAMSGYRFVERGV